MKLEYRRECRNCQAINVGLHEACLLCDQPFEVTVIPEEVEAAARPGAEGAPDSGPTESHPPEQAAPAVAGKPRPTPTPASRPRERASQIRFFLDGMGGEVRGKRFHLHKQALIGRDVLADINLYDGQVSRRHAMILVETDGIVVRDLGSANGTLVNGHQIVGPVLLQPGDLVTVGASSWKLVIVQR